MTFNPLKPEAGLYPDLSNSDYHRSNAVSSSTISQALKSIALIEWQRKCPIDEDKVKSLNLGTAVHAAILEPEEYSKNYVVMPQLNLRTKDGKAAKALFEEENADKIVLTSDEAKKIELMKASVMAHPDAGSLFHLPDGKAEQSIFWKDIETGLMCRFRPDFMSVDHQVIVDLKTTADIDKFHFSASDYGYHRQQAFYQEGFLQHFGCEATFLFVVISTSISAGRYPCRVFMFNSWDIERAEELNRVALRRYQLAQEQCSWSGVEPLSIPSRRAEFEQKIINDET